MKAATDVFPLVPVTAAITWGWRGKNAAAPSGAARVSDLDKCDTLRKRRRRRPLGHDGRSARRQRLRDESESVGLRPRHRYEQVARFDHATVGADACDLERGKARGADGIGGEKVGKLHGYDGV